MSRLTLRRDWIVVRLRESKALPMGLISVSIGKEWKQDQIECDVVGVGPWVDEVAVGDVVIIEGHAGKWLDAGTWDENDKGTTYRILKTDDILLVAEAQEVGAA